LSDWRYSKNTGLPGIQEGACTSINGIKRTENSWVLPTAVSQFNQ